MTSATTGHSATISDADIEQAQAVVGHYLPSRIEELYTEATYDSIRNFARSYGDDNPLYCDAKYASDSVWGGQIAPPLIGVALNRALQGDPRPPELRLPAFRGVHNFVSGTSWELYQPIRPGTRLYTFQGHEAVEVKQSQFAGKTVIITRRHVRMNEEGEVVSVARVTLIHAEREAAKERQKYGAIQPAVYSDDDIAQIDQMYRDERRRGGQTLFYEDVEVGGQLPPRAKGPLTVTDLLVFHTGGYGQSPFGLRTGQIGYRNRQRIPAFYVKNPQGVPDVVQRVHWDSEFAREIGVPNAYDYGVLRDCWLSHLITDWMGDDAWLSNLSSQIRRFNYLGDFHTISGEVAAKRTVDDRHLVDLELRGTNQCGEVTCSATATVIVPSRDDPAVALPQPPPELSEQAAQHMCKHRELSGG
jgi:acyl dehydratase